MNSQEKAILQTKTVIERKYGGLGGFVFDHLLHTIKLMHQAEEIAQSSLDIKGVNLEASEKEQLRQALVQSNARAAQRSKQIIVDSHNNFAKTMDLTGIEVTYAFSGDPNQPNATKTLVLGDISQGGKIARIDLSPWIKIGAKLA